MERGRVVLVTGLLPYDSGKTWVSIGLVRALRSLGVKACYAKPVAGHNAWSQFPTVLKSLEYGILVGEDASIATELLGGDLRTVNPVDLLLVPHDPESYPSLRDYYEHVEEQVGHVVLARFSSCRGGGDRHLFVRENYSRILPSMRSWIDRLVEALRAEETTMDELLRLLKSRGTEEELLACLSKLREGHEVVVVESFNNAALPFAGLLNHVDLPLLVAPGYVALLDRDSFARRVVESAMKLGDMGLAMDQVVTQSMVIAAEYLEPVLRPEDLELSKLAEHISRILKI